MNHGLLTDLIDRFMACRQRGRARAERDIRSSRRSLLAGFWQARKLWHKEHAKTADGFNFLDVMELTGKELCHSRVLAWLLDHDSDRLGTHAQGKAGFKLFLAGLGLPASYADKPYWVRLEVQGEESRMDIEVGAKKEFLIHVESKIWAGEGEDQTHREACDLKRRAHDLGIEKRKRIHGFFLTPEGRGASNPEFGAISWSKIAHVFEDFADKAAPADVKLFCRHYARALRTSVVREPEPRENDDG